MKIRHILFAIALIISSAAVDASRLPSDPPDYAACVEEASARFRVPELAIWLLLDVEGGTVGRTTRNTNGTYDIGPMQVNSWWMKHIRPLNITEEMVLNNLCVNISVGTWILATELERHRDLTKALAHYHSPTPHLQKIYLDKVVRAIDRRLGALKRQEPIATR